MRSGLADGRATSSRVVLILAMIVLSSGLGACAPAQGDVLAERLRECEVLSAGEVGPNVLAGLYAPDACYERCLAEASCADLEESLCRTRIDLLVACDSRCAFRCDDGSLLGPERVCDGFAQCMNREDEAGCEFDLVCADGTRVPGARCDGGWNCPDGSDEQDCPGSRGTACADGTGTYYEYYRCDGSPYCANGEDEAGCPSFVCADATVVTYRRGGVSPRCDGWSQCRDGSDEARCARLSPRCM